MCLGNDAVNAIPREESLENSFQWQTESKAFWKSIQPPIVG